MLRRLARVHDLQYTTVHQVVYLISHFTINAPPHLHDRVFVLTLTLTFTFTLTLTLTRSLFSHHFLLSIQVIYTGFLCASTTGMSFSSPSFSLFIYKVQSFQILGCMCPIFMFCLSFSKSLAVGFLIFAE